MWNFTPEGWIEVAIDEEMTSRAKKRAKSLGALNNSIRKGEGNLCGFLGEEIVLKAFPESRCTDSYNNDIRLFKKLTLEVKTKDRTVRPQPFYECSVAKYNDSQESKLYVFCSLYRFAGKYTKGWILGCMTPQGYKKRATSMKVGDMDPSNGMVFKADCHNLPISKLHSIRKFCENYDYLKKKYS